MSDRREDKQVSMFEITEPSEESELRAAWRSLVDVALPAAALRHGWPITENHCFARVLLDNAVGRPWREVVPPPAWRNTPLETLHEAVDLGLALLTGQEDIDRLNAASLRLRGKLRPSRGQGGCRRKRQGALEPGRDADES